MLGLPHLLWTSINAEIIENDLGENTKIWAQNAHLSFFRMNVFKIKIKFKDTLRGWKALIAKDGVSEYHLVVVPAVFQSNLTWDMENGEDNGVAARKTEKYLMGLRNVTDSSEEEDNVVGDNMGGKRNSDSYSVQHVEGEKL